MFKRRMLIFCIVLLCTSSFAQPFSRRKAQKKADTIRREYDSTVDSLSTSQLVSKSSEMLDSLTSRYVGLIRLVGAVWSPGTFGFEQFVGTVYEGQKKNGELLVPDAYRVCVKDALKRLASGEAADTKVFETLVDYYTLYKEMAKFYEDPSGSEAEFDQKIEGYINKRTKLAAKMEILAD